MDKSNWSFIRRILFFHPQELRDAEYIPMEHGNKTGQSADR